MRFFIVLDHGDCPGVSIYRDQLFFHNTTDTDLTVRAIGGSNGYLPPNDPLILPANRSRSVPIVALGLGGVIKKWTPLDRYVLVVNRLEVPDGVVVESRGEMIGRGLTVPCFCVGCAGSEVLGSFPLPVVRTLTPANVPEFHLDSELGTGLGEVGSVTNVGVYNGGSADTTARIEVRAACDDRLLEARTLAVPTATLMYSTGLRNTFAATSCATEDTAANYSRYVTVTMSQPGFSFVLSRSEVPLPVLPISSSLSR